MADINGNRFPNRLYGTRNGDRIAGRSGDDVIYGNGGGDVLSGEGGDDTIHVQLFPSQSGIYWDSDSYVRGGDGHDKAVLHFEVVTTSITLNAGFTFATAKSPFDLTHDTRLINLSLIHI